MGVILLSSLAAGIGSIDERGVIGLVGGTLAALAGWLIWAWLTYIIGTRLLSAPPTHADWGQLLRTTGFAASPGILRVFGVIPLLGWLVFLLAGLWMLAAFVVAVRQALDYTSTARAVGVCIIGWFAYSAIFLVLYLLLPRMT
jgi:hypothetical protein